MSNPATPCVDLDLQKNSIRVEQRRDLIGRHPDRHAVKLLIEGIIERRVCSGIGEDFGYFAATAVAETPVSLDTSQTDKEALDDAV